jgi:hypothetical protein
LRCSRGMESSAASSPTRPSIRATSWSRLGAFPCVRDRLPAARDDLVPPSSAKSSAASRISRRSD